VLVKYKTKPNGFVIYPLQYDIHPWIFGERTYTILKQTPNIINHDFKIDCLNEDFQSIKLTSCGNSLWTEQLNQEAQDRIRATFDYAKRSIGENLSLEQINRLLNGETVIVQPSQQNASALPIKMTELEFRAPGKRRIRID
jgi:hypothetical protein